MNSEQIEITMGISLILRDIINELLYARKTTPDGREYVVDRELPFRLRYRLNKNRLIFEKDAKEFQDRRLFALAKYGEPTEDGKNVVINDPQKQELFKQEISQIIDTPVTHTIVRLEPEDIELVSDTDINIAPDAMGLFIGYMTNDPELQKDLDTKINIRLNPPKSAETPAETPKVEEDAPTVNGEPPVIEEEKTPKKTTTRKPRTKSEQKRINVMEGKPVLDGLKEIPAEETKTEEAPKPKKTTAKKSTTTKKSTTKKVAKETDNG